MDSLRIGADVKTTPYVLMENYLGYLKGTDSTESQQFRLLSHTDGSFPLATIEAGLSDDLERITQLAVASYDSPIDEFTCFYKGGALLQLASPKASIGITLAECSSLELMQKTQDPGLVQSIIANMYDGEVDHGVETPIEAFAGVKLSAYLKAQLAKGAQLFAEKDESFPDWYDFFVEQTFKAGFAVDMNSWVATEFGVLNLETNVELGDNNLWRFRRAISIDDHQSIPIPIKGERDEDAQNLQGLLRDFSSSHLKVPIGPRVWHGKPHKPGEDKTQLVWETEGDLDFILDTRFEEWENTGDEDIQPL